MQATTKVPPVIDADTLAALLGSRPDVRLLDVRTPGEFESAHIAGSYNVPLDTLGEHAREIRATVNEAVVLICQSGARARRAELALRECSMENLHVLDGGMAGWLAAGQAVSRGPERMSLERQVRIAAGGMAAAGALLALLVDPLWAVLPALVGSGLVVAGVTDTCALAAVLSKLPHNRAASCDVDAMVAALKQGSPPVGAGSRPAATAAARGSAS